MGIRNQAGLDAHIQGLREAKAAFQKMPEVFRDRMLAATETTVREIARLAQANLRRSPSIQTRALHDHVAWKMTRTNGRGKVGIAMGSTTIAGRRVKGIIVAGRGGSALRSAGARRDIPSKRAHHVEFGNVHMPAEPFMRPAAEAEKNNYLDRCKRAGQEAERDLAAIGGGLR